MVNGFSGNVLFFVCKVVTLVGQEVVNLSDNTALKLLSERLLGFIRHRETCAKTLCLGFLDNFHSS